MKKKIAIFYISKYSGHYRAASAIEEGLRYLHPEVDVVKLNAITYINPIMGSIINRAYIELIKKKPEIWEHIYDNPEVIEKTKKAREALHRFNMSKVRRLIEDISPDAVYCTQAFPCGLVADYKRTLKSDLRLIGVLTDHAPHSYWLYDEVDHYVVPSPETGKRLQEKGVLPGKLKVYGIPVDPVFAQKHEKSPIKKELGLREDLPIVLIMGGSQGLGAMEEAVHSLERDTIHKYQMVIVSGSNKRLYKKFKKYFSKKTMERVLILPYFDKIDILMEIADIVVSKAGGMTTAEAMVKSLPMVIVSPIPGHERMNADYLVSKGAAVEVRDCTVLHEEINRIFDSPGRIDNMKENIKAIARAQSAIDAAALAFGE